MDLSQKRHRWERSLVQATHFADTDNTTDAVARVRLVLREIDAELERTAAPAERAQLDLFRKRVARQLAALEEAHAGWKEKVAGRHGAFLDREESAYEAPLPGVKR